jgi:hypothetical protein
MTNYQNLKKHIIQKLHIIMKQTAVLSDIEENLRG